MTKKESVWLDAPYTQQRRGEQTCASCGHPLTDGFCTNCIHVANTIGNNPDANSKPHELKICKKCGQPTSSCACLGSS